MEVDDVIKKRISVKDYSNRPVKVELIYDLIDAATYAPSSGNLQNWRFIIVTENNKKEELAYACLDQEWMKKAPVVIVICDDKERVMKIYDKRGKLYAIQNCAAAAENVLLKAEDLGLSTCWVGGFDVNAVRRILSIPDNIDPEIILTAGYAKEKQKAGIKRVGIENIVYFNEYNHRMYKEPGISEKIEKTIDATKDKGKEKLGKLRKLLKI